MLAVAVMACAFFLSRDARQEGVSTEVIWDLVFWTVVGGILGARIFFILLNLSFFASYPFEIVMIQNGGLAWQGSLIGGIIVAAVFIRIKRLSFLKIADLSAPYIALGQSIGRIGCFLNGCCYGREVVWGPYFPAQHAHLHPTQLYCSAGLLIVFLILKRLQPQMKTPGQLFMVYLLFASLLRFGVEFFRADHEIVVLGLSIFQIVCVVIFGAALYGNIYLQGRRTQSAS